MAFIRLKKIKYNEDRYESQFKRCKYNICLFNFVHIQWLTLGFVKHLRFVTSSFLRMSDIKGLTYNNGILYNN